MSDYTDKIVDAIRLLVEDGATVTYEIGTDEPTDYYQGKMAGILIEQQRIIEIIEKRRNYECRCSCDCHAEPAPCLACQVDNELIEIIKGDKSAN